MSYIFIVSQTLVVTIAHWTLYSVNVIAVKLLSYIVKLVQI